MSHMSMCDAPPQRKNRIVDFAFARRVADAGADRRGTSKCQAGKPRPDATNIARRLTADVGMCIGPFIFGYLPTYGHSQNH